MSESVVWLTIFILSVFVGIEVISKVSSTLHTPLMSGANAIHGVILLGAILVTGSADNDVALVVGLIAIVLAAVNMVGGFVVTDRMLQMFVRKKPAKADPTDGGAGGIFAPDFEDEIVAGSCVTHDGEVRHEATREALAGGPA